MSDALLRQLAVKGPAGLRPSNAVAAILVRDDGQYIMQLRDAKDEIFYPAHWGCFGGAVEAGEDPAEALTRELKEEIELEVSAATRFTQFDFDFSALGHGSVYRVFYEVAVPDAAYRDLVLHEGADIKSFDGRDLLTNQRVTPYDAFAIWMHMFRSRFVS